MATTYTIENAYRALPYLVHAAQQRATLTYKELAAKIGRHHRSMPHVLGYIRDEVCTPRNLPLINAIVVNTTTRLPGESFLAEGTAGLSAEAYRATFEAVRDQVFACTAWNSLLDELGLTPIQKSIEEINQEGHLYTTLLKQQRIAREGPRHQQLKHYVACHPEAVGLVRGLQGEEEYGFISGDVCDVVLNLSEQGMVVIEIKDGQQRGELVKGIYQAIKYRALMIAEQGQGLDFPVRALLIAYQIPDDLVDFARRFNIECYTIAAVDVETFAQRVQ